MLEQLNKPKGDPILSLMDQFQKDIRKEKIDLGIGIYKDKFGKTPIMKAVRNASMRLASTERTKSYVGLVGDEQFNTAIQELILKGTNALSRASTIQTPGASGALRMLAELIKIARPDARVWISNPSYINHRPIMEKTGLEVFEYPYLNEDTKQVNEKAMLKTIEKLGKKDVLLIHGCCHNPSGADISIEAWEKIAHLAQKNGFLPFIDIAYQGLGESMEKDILGVQTLVNIVDEAVISTSCSKNFSLYRERTGAAIVIGKELQKAKDARIHMGELARGTYSMPPASGAAIVAKILNDPILQKQWTIELEQMRDRVLNLRKELVRSFRIHTNTNKFDYIGLHKGMFSLTGLNKYQIEELQNKHAIYLVGNRINIAGLKENQIDQVVSAFVDVSF